MLGLADSTVSELAANEAAITQSLRKLATTVFQQVTRNRLHKMEKEQKTELRYWHTAWQQLSHFSAARIKQAASKLDKRRSSLEQGQKIIGQRQCHHERKEQDHYSWKTCGAQSRPKMMKTGPEWQGDTQQLENLHRADALST